jgi:hypothetical protein
VNPLELARYLGRLEAQLEELTRRSQCGYDCPAEAAAAAYLCLLDRLTAIGSKQILAMVNESLVIHSEITERHSRDRKARREQADAEYDEAERRHELAITAECPYCGAAPGLACRTRGPSGVGHPKGVHDHADRYRAAEGLFAPPGPDELEAP